MSMSSSGEVSLSQAGPSLAWKVLKLLAWTASLKSTRVSSTSFLSSLSDGISSLLCLRVGGDAAREGGANAVDAGGEVTWEGSDAVSCFLAGEVAGRRRR